MNDPIALRKKVRVVLSALPKDRTLPIASIFEVVARDPLLTDLKLAEVEQAIHWNEARGLLDFQRNEDEERDEWFLTKQGWKKEGL